MSFQALLADLEALSTGSANEGDTVAKSMANDGDDAGAGEGGEDDGGEGGDADDDKIVAAAADGEAAGDNEGDAPLGKSLKIIGENGDEEDAIDATDLIKSLVEKIDGLEGETGKVLVALTDLVKSQAEQIGALTGQVGKLAAAGRGRRAVVSVADKPDLSKSLTNAGEGGEGGDKPDGIPANEFMAKAMDACTAGKITGLDVARAESYLNRGLDVPANIKAKVLA